MLTLKMRAHAVPFFVFRQTVRLQSVAGVIEGKFYRLYDSNDDIIPLS